MPCSLSSAEPVGRLPDCWRPTSKAASSSMVSNHEGGPATARRCLICGGSSEKACAPGLAWGGRRRMSGIKKTQSLGSLPDPIHRRQTIAGALPLSLVLSRRETLSFSCQCGLGLESGLGLEPRTRTLTWSLTWTLTWAFLSSVKHPRSARSAALLAPCHPSTPAGQRFNGACVVSWLAGCWESAAIRKTLAAWVVGGGALGLWVSGSLEPTRDIGCRRVGADQDGEADPTRSQTEHPRYRTREREGGRDPDGSRSHGTGQTGPPMHRQPCRRPTGARLASAYTTVLGAGLKCLSRNTTGRSASCVLAGGINEMRPLHRERRTPVLMS